MKETVFLSQKLKRIQRWNAMPIEFNGGEKMEKSNLQPTIRMDPID